MEASARRSRSLGRRLHVWNGLGPKLDGSRRRLPALRDRGSLDVQRYDELRLGLRLRLGMGAVPLRTLGIPSRLRLVLDSWSSLRGCVGHLARRSRGLRLRRLGARSSELVLVSRLRRWLVVRLVSPLRLLRVLPAHA